GFTRAALDDVRKPSDPAFITAQRTKAFDLFDTLPMPSPETEEWRYTDLRKFELDAYQSFHPQPWAETLDDVKPDLLEAAGDVGEPSALGIQHDSSVIS